MHDNFVRPYVGDVLAIVFVYIALRAIAPLGLTSAITVTLAIALAIEIAQALDLRAALGLANNELARTVLGGAFDWLDLAAYAAGALLVVVAERVLRR